MMSKSLDIWCHLIVFSYPMVSLTAREADDGHAAGGRLARGRRRDRRLSGGWHAHLYAFVFICLHLSASWPAVRAAIG